MKKKIIILVIILLIFSISNNERIVSVFDMGGLYEIYYLDFKEENLNTNNFESYFNENIDIIKIEPYINDIYKNKIGNVNYLFDHNDINYNINNFKEKYLKILKNNNYIDDYNKYSTNGIKINMVKVYTTETEILKLVNNKKIKYYFTYTDYQHI